MKRFLYLLLALPCFLACHQVKELNDETYIVFPLRDTLADPINWQQENMRAEFQLRGNNPLRYALHPVSDTITQLSHWVDGMWQLQENIYTSGWVYTRALKDSIQSYFKITDFDKDGDQDLTCWVDTNAHGNVWSIVFINDEKQHRLVKLINQAENNSYIWDDPRYNPTTGMISTEKRSGMYGEQNTASYKLKGVNTTPISKEAINLSDPPIRRKFYTGVNGKWKLVKTVKQ